MNDHKEDITFREIIFFTKDFVSYLMKKWYFFILSIGIIFAYYYISSKLTPVTHQAVTKYIINEEGGGSGLGGLLGQFGFGGGSTGVNLDEI